jgi:uncharacterized membrane protein
MNDPLHRVGKFLLNYFFRGLLLLVPITIIAWALWQALAFLDGLIPTDIPGMGLLILLGIITFAGWLGSTIMFHPLVEIGEEMLQRIPFLKTMYGALKDLVEALVGNKRKFDRPVLIRLGEGMDVHRLGFITQEDLSHLGLGPERVAVYMPHAFNWSGNLMIVPVKNITPLHARAADVMKFVVSGGVSQVDEEHVDVEEPR